MWVKKVNILGRCRCSWTHWIDEDDPRQTQDNERAPGNCRVAHYQVVLMVNQATLYNPLTRLGLCLEDLCIAMFLLSLIIFWNMAQLMIGSNV